MYLYTLICMVFQHLSLMYIIFFPLNRAQFKRKHSEVYWASGGQTSQVLDISHLSVSHKQPLVSSRGWFFLILFKQFTLSGLILVLSLWMFQRIKSFRSMPTASVRSWWAHLHVSKVTFRNEKMEMWAATLSNWKVCLFCALLAHFCCL